MKHLIILLSFLFAINANAQEPANIFGTGRGNLKLTSGVFTKTRPNGNLIAALPAYFTKDSVDKYINFYNDTTNKFSIDCVDSLWKVGNIVKHRNWQCDIQEFTLDPANLSGCLGGDVYHKTNLADTSMLVPSPECGDILTITLDTCKEYLYIRGTAPNKWNYVGAYLTNANCADPLPCKDSLWRVNDKVYHRNVDCITQIVLLGKDTFTNNFTISGDTFRIFRNDGTIYTQIYSPGAGVLDSLVTLTANSTNFKFTIGPNRVVSSVEFEAGDRIKFEDGVTGAGNKFGYMKISSSAKDTLRTTVANSSTFTVTHSPARTTDFTLKAGNGIKFDSASVGDGSAHGIISIATDTSSTFFDGLANQKITSNLVSTNNVSLALTPQSGSDKTTIVGAGITTITQSPGSASTNGTVTITSTEVDGSVTNEIQNIRTTNDADGIKLNLTGIGSVGSLTIKAGDGLDFVNSGVGSGTDATITLSTEGATVCTSLPTPHVYDLNVVTGDGVSPNCLKLDRCNWNLSPTDATGTLTFVVLANSDELALEKCMYTKSCNCSLAFQSIEDPNKLLVQNGSDLQGLFLSMIDVINRQGRRIAALETPQNFASAGAVNVSARVYDQQSTILKQQKLIEELTARLDRLDRLQASK